MPISPASIPQAAGSPPVICWTEAGQACSALWRSERGALPPKRVLLADDTLSADSAYRLACESTALLWRGDFHNARHLLQALARRAHNPPKKPRHNPAAGRGTAGEALSLTPTDTPAAARGTRVGP